METCLSGLRYIFAKDAGFNRPREFESRRLRNYKNERPWAPFFVHGDEGGVESVLLK